MMHQQQKHDKYTSTFFRLFVKEIWTIILEQQQSEAN